MKILSLEMNNFRQYYGKQSIRFADDRFKNTTIILGENGKGKTGIYRAIMFALFGSTNIPLDGESKKVHLVNFLHIEKEAPNIAEASVTVEFEHDDEHYILNRSILATRRNKEKINERLGSCKLQFKDEYGNISPKIYTEESEIKKIINNVLDEEIKDFFLFDAEKIDTLTKEDAGNRKQVKDAILNLLQMNNIQEAREVITKEKNRVEERLRDTINDQELNKLEFKKFNILKSIDEKKDLISIYKKEIDESERMIQEHNMTLNKNKDILEIQGIIQENNNKVEEYNTFLNQLNNDIAQLYFKSAPFLIMKNTLKSNAGEFENFLGEAKVNISIEIIEESLEQNHCVVCSSKLDSSDGNRQYVESLLESYRHSSTYDLARDMLNMYERKMEEFDDNETKLSFILKEYNNTVEMIDKIEAENESYKKQVIEHAKLDINLAHIEKMIEDEKNNKREKDKNYIIEENNLDNLVLEYNELTEKLESIYSSKSRNEVEKEKYGFLKELDENLGKISKEFNDEMRVLLGNETTKIFQKLIDKKDIELIEKIEINGRFEINAISKKDLSILNDLSQGQGQILSLSFITALARVAVNKIGSNMIDYPLFMDSPFNRLSGNNRDHLINSLPELTSQWILLLTDTEYTYAEEKVFKESARLGKAYKINQIELNYSQIEEVSLDETLATRGGL